MSLTRSFSGSCDSRNFPVLITGARSPQVCRVHNSGDVARVMIYHKHSMVEYMLSMRYALLKLPMMKLADVYAKYLKVPIPRPCSVNEARQLFRSFTRVEISTRLTYGDLLTSSAGQRHQEFALLAARVIWPRRQVRRILLAGPDGRRHFRVPTA